MLVGAAVGAKIHNLWAVFFIAIILHLVTDRLPHWDYVNKKNSLAFMTVMTFLDIALGLAVIFYFFGWQPGPYIIWGALFGIAPDLLNPLKGIFAGKNKIVNAAHSFCHKFHCPEKNGTPGAWFQIFFTAGMLLILYLIKINVL